MKQSILHVALVVNDYDEAIEFYCGKLKFKLVDDQIAALAARTVSGTKVATISLLTRYWRQ